MEEELDRERNTTSSKIDDPAIINDTFQKGDINFANIPPIHLCIHRIADVRIVNATYLFDISEVNGWFYVFSKENHTIENLNENLILNFQKQKGYTFIFLGSTQNLGIALECM